MAHTPHPSAATLQAKLTELTTAIRLAEADRARYALDEACGDAGAAGRLTAVEGELTRYRLQVERLDAALVAAKEAEAQVDEASIVADLDAAKSAALDGAILSHAKALDAAMGAALKAATAYVEAGRARREAVHAAGRALQALQPEFRMLDASVAVGSLADGAAARDVVLSRTAEFLRVFGLEHLLSASYSGTAGTVETVVAANHELVVERLAGWTPEVVRAAHEPAEAA
ncbi:hypothetical protein [Rubrivivax albus]|uniref:Uncharacterized protein n=1 Tax=Rubrivivax albus TaxID=2499835 RepID=A0A3S2VZI0_9BURK|nr:hypothetical protein [Rubrivivax albus]RVT53968.1 hypothetical protein ENE75_03570 [Rubrivivax albus]